MLRTLLGDRFKLRVHREERALPIYALVLARTDRRVGGSLMPVTVDCASLRAQAAATVPGPPTRPPCAIGGTGGSLIGGAVTMAQLADVLSNRVGRVVIDKTELPGRFNVDLAWTPDSSSTGPQTDISAPSLFTALQEQLGLRLQSSAGPVEVLVIDSVERPTPDP